MCTHLTCGLSEADPPGFEDIGAGLGQTVDGTLRQFGIFHETSLMRMPSNLNFLEAATLPCSGLTAWNALFGLQSKSPRAGDTVLIQGHRWCLNCCFTGTAALQSLSLKSSSNIPQT